MLIVWFAIGVGMLASGVGMLVLIRSPRHPAHLSFALGMIAVSVEFALATLGLPEISGAEAVEWTRLRILTKTLVPAPWVVFACLYSRGDFQATMNRWRWTWMALLVVPILVAYAFRGELVIPEMPTATGWAGPRLGLAGVLVCVLDLLAAVVVLTQIERTFRAAVGVMRWRIKYLILGTTLLFGFRLYAASQTLLYGSPAMVTGRVGPAALLVACGLMCVGLFRGRVFDVDVYPSQALVYRSLAVLLTGAYLLIVGVLAKVVAWAGNPGGLPIQALVAFVALAVLAVLLLSERSRHRLRSFLSRHLRRPVHDYRELWRRFTARTTSLVQETDYCRAVTVWVSETFQTLSASLWQLDDGHERLRLGASTLLVNSRGSPIELTGNDLLTALGALSRLTGPTILDAEGHSWAASLVRLHPGVFPDGGRRVGVPLQAGGRLLGLITLGDRVSGAPFSTEDFELLKCVADQVAAGLLGLRLSGQLVRAKEMEAFQAMSAFFVHDLKNTASTLSLTLQNLHQHFGNPAFRDDALRAVQKSVQHLNGLIARLGRLRQELRVQLVSAEFPAAVASALSSVTPMERLRFTRTSDAMPPVMIDEEQFGKVVVNLVLNARDAMGPDGEVQVKVGRTGPWAVLEVSDTGIGMTPEFVRDSLFRPFQTTKHNGMGIGMFHSKMIVEAHGGRIEVVTSPGKGTTINVLVPFARSV